MLGVLFNVLGRGYVLKQLELPIEIGDVVKAGFIANPCYGIVVFYK